MIMMIKERNELPPLKKNNQTALQFQKMTF